MLGSKIFLPGWIALAACLIALTFALQKLHGQIVEYDDGVYWQSLRGMADGHSLFASVFSSQPPLFLLGIYPFYAIFGQSLAAARLALLLFSLVGVAGAYVAGRALGRPVIGAVACLLLSLDPLYKGSAHAVQVELPSIALQIWAVAFAALAMRSTGGRRAWLVVSAGVALGCALLTKVFAVVALAPIVLFLSTPFPLHWSNDLGQRAWLSIYRNLRLIVPTLGDCW
jgi:4-amino-4-deoxy-L-arabinose transferase-like glycosyltransferase